LVLDINKQLRHNRSILRKLCPAGSSVVRKEVLDAMDYRADLFTSLYMNDKKQVYYLCYDYGVLPLIQKNVPKALIVSKQSYMEPWSPWRYAKKSRQDSKPPKDGLVS
jgi:hypothetical protein